MAERNGKRLSVTRRHYSDHCLSNRVAPCVWLAEMDACNPVFFRSRPKRFLNDREKLSHFGQND